MHKHLCKMYVAAFVKCFEDILMTWEDSCNLLLNLQVRISN